MLKTFLPIKTHARRLSRQFASSYTLRFTLDPDQRIPTGDYEAPALLYDGRVLNNAHDDCDQFTRKTVNATATFFVRDDNNFVRVATSIKSADGQRAVGTALDTSHPARKALLNGQSYIGYAEMFGRLFMTEYTPLFDSTNRVIGSRSIVLHIAQTSVFTVSNQILAGMFLINVLAYLLLWSAHAVILGQSLMFWAAAGVSCIAAPLLAHLIIRRGVHNPLRQGIEAARDVSTGHLETQVEVKRRDEASRLLHAINGVASGLAGIVRRVRRSSEEILSAAEQVATGTSDLSHRTQSQAASLEQTSAAMAEITATVQQNADNARDASVLVSEAAHLAHDSGELVEQLSSRMSSVRDSASKVEGIISTIDGIAFQTNILALNAAVEAARAGEYGRGFSVVAAEVRTLAKRSADAAQEIKTLITNSVAEIDTANQLATRARENATDTAQRVEESAPLVEQIATATLEQSQGIEEVHQALSQMDQSTQENAALVEELEATATQMQDHASQLLRAVKTFRTAEDFSRREAEERSRPSFESRPAYVTARPMSANTNNRRTARSREEEEWSGLQDLNL